MSMWSADTPRPPRRLWFAIIGAPLAWAAQGAVSWLFVEEACLGAQREPAASSVFVRVISAGIFIAALIIGLAAISVSVREWSRSSNRELGSAETMDRKVFLEVVAVFVSIAFTAGIVWMGMGALWLPGCERVR